MNSQKIFDIATEINELVGFEFPLEDAHKAHLLIERVATRIVLECLSECETAMETAFDNYHAGTETADIAQGRLMAAQYIADRIVKNFVVKENQNG